MRSVLLSRFFRSGESPFAAGLLAVGAYWVFAALQLGVWDDGDPQSGLMPLLYGSALVAFALAALLGSFRDDAIAEDDSAAGEPVAKPLIVLGVLVLTLIGLRFVGVALSLFVMLSAVFVFVERLPVRQSLMVALAVTVALVLVFRVWLGVPLPAGPWGV